MEFKDIVHKRYAVKKFDGKKIPQFKVDELLELIRHAPSSFNIQPWKIKIIEDQTTKEKLLPASWNQPQITSCSHLLIFCADTDIKQNIDKLEALFREKGIPTNYIPIMHDFEKSMTPAQKLSWAQRQLYLALGNAVNGAKALGFDSCPMEGFSSEEYSKILNIPPHIVPTALCAVGYAADTQYEKLRFSKEDILC
ncbi:MAG TPA: NAD(P)H-dependent oxidoreductase [Candidatus Nanoarchaeia archaeon]|nr:NAD(P)H-dependent oxidoreductase [Candidatus Nanoarchaeia archaeon]